MKVDKSEQEIILQALSKWEAEGKLTSEKTAELKKDVSLKKPQQQIIAQYFFIIALSCTLLAFGAIFLNEKILEKIKLYFSLGNISIAIITLSISTIWYIYIFKRRNAITKFTYEVYMTLGALSALTALVYVGKTFSDIPDYTIFCLLGTIVLFTLSTVFTSNALWIYAIFFSISYWGFTTTDHSINYLFWEMNYPVRFMLFGILIIVFSLLQSHIPFIAFSQQLTYTSGMLLFFISLWAVSIFGNYNTLDEWAKVRQSHELVYGIIFGIISILSFILGLRYKNMLARDLGILFLLLNLYTRYFEFFWDTMNKGLFFAILALTFGVLGRWLDKKSKSQKNQPV